MRHDRGLPLVITQGDAAGIGPEIIAKFFHEPAQGRGCFVLGDVATLQRAVAQIDAVLPLAVIEQAADAWDVPVDCLPIMQARSLPDDLASVSMGQVDTRAGAAAARCIEQAAALAMRGEVAGLVTAPIHKEALAAAGVRHPGHTEMLQSLAAAGASAPPVRMMLANPELRTVLVTIHMSLREAIDAITFDAVLETIRIAHESARLWGSLRPHIAVAGLNPHAGEGGRFGREEIDIIAPAVAAARLEGIHASGPHAPDTVFMRARHTTEHPGEFDLVVAMTHDHGLIPVKYLGVEEGVNVTLGLPFVRTSPDHGTAFDIAGSGRANPSSLAAAVRMAKLLVGGATDG